MKRQHVIGVGFFLLALLALVVLFWPRADTQTGIRATERDDAPQMKVAKRKVVKLTPQGEEASDEPLPLEEDPAIPVVTETCKWIVKDERRHVPQWVMLDNLRDRGQLFVEDDIRCLTAAGVTPAILDFAERYQDQNKLQGKVGTPTPPPPIY